MMSHRPFCCFYSKDYGRKKGEGVGGGSKTTKTRIDLVNKKEDKNSKISEIVSGSHLST